MMVQKYVSIMKIEWKYSKIEKLDLLSKMRKNSWNLFAISVRLVYLEESKHN